MEIIKEEILDLIVGYGVNQTGACLRDGSLQSYDFYGTKEEVEAYIASTEKAGYGNTLCGMNEVTIWDEIDAQIKDEENVLGRDLIKEEVKRIAVATAISEMEKIIKKEAM